MRARGRVLSLAAWSVLLGAAAPIAGCDPHAGWPHGIADLEGTWWLDGAHGEFPVAPPESLTFSPGTEPGLVKVVSGQHAASFRIDGMGRFVFEPGQSFEPILPVGTSDVHTMTHTLPQHRAWAHLTFYPDGMPLGQDSARSFIRYERE